MTPQPFPAYLGLDVYADGRPRPVSPPEITVHARAGCHLCEAALAVLEDLRGELGPRAFSVRTVDIEDDDATLKAYLERIPVIALDGRELYDFFVDREDLRRRLLDMPAS